ncbi:hypothetical protein RRG08_054990 [Elysia crispata]|uniref:Uncharacterized protein n=1 Tax=Elysia crispata TaxID=231223 RepID=A0AAE0XRU7_9GAST|nr:hypothetical protein RRG08_054990 [Elysia crispata]
MASRLALPDIYLKIIGVISEAYQRLNAPKSGTERRGFDHHYNTPKARVYTDTTSITKSIHGMELVSRVLYLYSFSYRGAGNFLLNFLSL